MKKIVSLLLVCLLVLFSFVGCASSNDENTDNNNENQTSNNNSNAVESNSNSQTENGDEGINENVQEAENVTFSITRVKSEILSPFEDMMEDYMDLNPNVEITYVDASEIEQLTALYASGNAPTLYTVDAIFEDYQPYLMDLSTQPWIEHTADGTLDFVTVDDGIYGMPVTVEAFGYIYNKAILDEAVGGDFDTSTINTVDALEELFIQVDALTGISAIHVSPMDWSLGAHFANVLFTNQSEVRDERHQFMQDMLDGNIDLSENDIYIGWVDTLDLMIEYNQNKEAPLAPVYDDGPLALGLGEAGIWFMGNWAVPQISEADPEGEYGFLPVPVNNDSSFSGNNGISVGVPSYWVIDESQSDEAQRQAACDFLNWMITDPTGQDYYVNQFSLIPVFDNFEISPADYLNQSVMEYTNSGHALEWMNTYFPSDGWSTMGATMQKYLDGIIDREGMAEELEQYWASAQ